MNSSDITVIIPTYRRPKLLARALLSVLRQEVPGIHIHVFDNASGDETARVVEEFGRRQPIAYTCHPTNLGITANFQLAIRSVETPYCCILNDDDIQLPGLFSSALQALPANPTAGAFCGRTMVYAPGRSGSPPTTRVQATSWQPGIYRAGQATSHMIREHFTPTGVVFSTPALQGARFEFGDMEMMARLAERHDFVVSDQLLGVYVLHPRSWSVSQSLEDSRRVGLRRLREYLDLETLTDEERQDAVLGCVGELMTAQYWGALGAIFKGEGTPQLRRDLTQSGAMFAGLLGARRSPGERFAHLVVTSLAGLSEAPPSRTMGLALRGALKISGAIDRLATRPRRRTAAEEAALAEVGALDRSADAFFERLPAS